MTARKALVVGSTGNVSELASTDALDGVTGWVSKATTPDATDFKRPVLQGDRWLNTTNGITYTYVNGAWVYDNAAALSRYVPAYLSNGAASPIALNADGTIPAYLSDGTYTPIPTQA